jgi:hypothetical protein
MRRLAVAVAAVAVVAVGVGVAFAQTTGDERIYACVNNGDGAMRQVAGPNVQCNKGWHRISWASEQPSPASFATYQNKSDSRVVQPGGDSSALATCDEGDIVTGGGFETNSRLNFELSAANDDMNGWLVAASNPTAAEARIMSFVVCLDTTP